MKKRWVIFLTCEIVMLIFSTTAFAQLDVNTDINSMIKNARNQVPQKGQKKLDKKKKKEKGKGNLEIPNVDIFKPKDAITLGDTKGDTKTTTNNTIVSAWGDPVEMPRIRRNCASNLFGTVRHNPDGSRRYHGGFDYFAPYGTNILSVGAGIVAKVGVYGDYGNFIMVKHEYEDQVYYSMYAHLSAMSAKEGDMVQKGTIIGKSGNTGNASNMTGEDEHVHFECRTSSEFGSRCQLNPNTIVATHFYSADPDNEYQSNVSVVIR